MRVMFAARAIDNMAGGVERMVITIMNALAARGHRVELLTWDKRDAAAFYPIDPSIVWHRLALGDPDRKAGASLVLRRAERVRAILRRQRPQSVTCFQDGPFIATRLYALGLGIPILAAERNAPTRFDFTRAGRRRDLVLQSLRLAKRVIIQCESYRALYPDYLRRRIVTIPNPVFPARLRARPEVAGPDGRLRLLSVGRLSYQKNYGALVEAFVSLAPRFPEWDLTIVGDGEERASLERLIAEKGLGARVKLPGASTAVEQLYAGAHLFALPSRWEGFPNALAEAMSHGLPAVGFEGCAGVRDLISPGRTGALAAGNGDAGSLAGALAALMADASARAAIGRAAAAGIAAFDPDQVFDCWEQVLGEAALTE
jgi:glycosyltransferase involved in cell wall biosynthesis